MKRSREMNRYCKHQSGEGLGWSDMANVSEPSFDVPLDSELPKMLIGSDQNGKGSQCYFSNVGNTQILQPRDTDWCLSDSQRYLCRTRQCRRASGNGEGNPRGSR